MPLSYLQLVVLDNVQRPLHSARVGEEPDLALLKVSDDRNLSLDSAVSSQSLEVLKQAVGVARETDPVAVYKYFGLLHRQQVFSRQLLELLNAPVLQLVNDVSRVRAD